MSQLLFYLHIACVKKHSRRNKGLLRCRSLARHELGSLTGGDLAFHQVFVNAELSFELFCRNDDFADFRLVGILAGRVRRVNTSLHGLLALPLSQIICWNALHTINLYIKAVPTLDCVGDSVCAQLVYLINVNCQTASGIESSGAVRASKVLGFLM